MDGATNTGGSSGSDTKLKPKGIARQLETNRQRRADAATEVSAAQRELRELIVLGYRDGLDVSEMARHAKISRDTAHRIVKESGIIPWRQKQKWAGEVLTFIPRGDFEQNVFRAVVNVDLLNALGSRPDPEVPQSLPELLAHSVKTMHDNGHVDFVPTYTDEARLMALSWPR